MQTSTHFFPMDLLTHFYEKVMGHILQKDPAFALKNFKTYTNQPIV
jgi:hypothetical protein